MDAFLSYSWDGNVRELSNIVERSVITTEDSLIKAAYEKHGSSRKVAAALGISPSKANRLIQRYAHA